MYLHDIEKQIFLLIDLDKCTRGYVCVCKIVCVLACVYAYESCIYFFQASAPLAALLS